MNGLMVHATTIREANSPFIELMKHTLAKLSQFCMIIERNTMETVGTNHMVLHILSRGIVEKNFTSEALAFHSSKCDLVMYSLMKAVTTA